MSQGQPVCQRPAPDRVGGVLLGALNPGWRGSQAEGAVLRSAVFCGLGAWGGPEPVHPPLGRFGGGTLRPLRTRGRSPRRLYVMLISATLRIAKFALGVSVGSLLQGSVVSDCSRHLQDLCTLGAFEKGESREKKSNDDRHTPRYEPKGGIE